MNPNRLSDRLEALKKYTGYLKEYKKKVSLPHLKKDHTIQGAVCHYMQLAIECMMDIGEMCISDLGLRRPEDGREVFEILGEAKILPKSFARRISPISGFRNVLVHQYLKVNFDLVHQHLQQDLKDFDTFARHIAQRS